MSLPFNKNYVDANIDSTTSDATTTPNVTSTFDRWGDTLTVTDARHSGWVTSYAYNAAGQE